MKTYELQAQINRLLYRDPGAETNVLAVENVGTNVRFTVDESDTRREIAKLAHESAAYERAYVEAAQERDKYKAELDALKKANAAK